MAAIIEINADKFDEFKASKYFLLDFYSTECPNCEKLKPVLDSLNEELHDKIIFAKIFRQDNRALAESLDIFSSPTVLFFVDGVEKFRLSGHIFKHDLKEKLLQHLS